MKEAIIVALLITTLISVTKWIKWKVAMRILMYYMEKNQHKLPTKEELPECADYVKKQMIKDLKRRLRIK